MIDLREVLAACPGAEVVQAGVMECTGFAFDSRTTTVGQCFVALRTERRDGHAFVEAARRAGARAALVGAPVALDGPMTVVQVPDPEAALGAYAAWLVRRRSLRVVGVTGTVGKTSAKEAIAHVLAPHVRVHRSPGNYTGQLGLPIALGDLEPDHEFSVLEMASGHPGELATLLGIAPPEVMVLTALTPVHLGAFRDLDAIEAEMGALDVARHDGTMLLFDPTDARAARIAARGRGAALACAIDADADYRAHDVVVHPHGTQARVVTPRATGEIRLPWVGRHFVQAALFALATAERVGVDLEAACHSLRSLPVLAGRLRPVSLAGGALLLDDSFSASPASVAAALHTLRALPARRRIAVVADMDPLGPATAAAHEALGPLAAASCDLLVTLGRAAAAVGDAAIAAGLPSTAVRKTFLPEHAALDAAPAAGDVVLVKGGSAAQPELVVQALAGAALGPAAVRPDRSTEHISVVQTERPTWLEIDLEAIAANVRALQAVAAPARLMPVLKGDAYGHGAVQVAHTVVREGVDLVGVAMVSEAEALRASGLDVEILLLSPTPPWQARRAVRAGVAVTVFDTELVDALARASADLGVRTRVHVKVDSGMHRLGAAPADVPAILARIAVHPALEAAGLFSHLATADAVDAASRAKVRAQAACMQDLVDELVGAGTCPPLVHLLNTSGLLVQDLPRYDVVRCGLAVYGYLEGGPPAVRLQPALQWKSLVAQVRSLAAGETVGYGATWRAERPTRLATIPVGYGDGFRRAPQTWRHVLVRGCEAPVVGRVSMDQITVDVTDVDDATAGDEVVLIGRQGEHALWASTVAEWLGTNEYEVLTAILARVPRIARRG